MNQRFYIPKKDVLVRNHDGRGHIPAEGAFRMQNQYYDRRVKDGDLIIREDAARAAEPAKNQKAKKGDSE